MSGPAGKVVETALRWQADLTGMRSVSLAPGPSGAAASRPGGNLNSGAGSSGSLAGPQPPTMGEGKPLKVRNSFAKALTHALQTVLLRTADLNTIVPELHVPINIRQVSEVLVR